MIAVHVLLFLAGAFVVLGTVGSAVRTVVLPRAVPSRITRRVFRIMRGIFYVRAGRSASYERSDRVLAFYGPTSLLVLLFTWMALLLGGYVAMFWANGVRPLRLAFDTSGSSLLTLGFERSRDLPNTALAVSEGAFGLVILRLLITYL